jgi:hypothetical protein
MSAFTDCLQQYALLTLEKQDKLGFLLGEHTYELDLDAGKIRFSNDIELTCQALGTESDNTLNWLWAWADEQTEVPATLIQASRELRDWGSLKGVQEFILPSIDLDQADGHTLSLIAVGLCKASAYYRDSYEGGAVFFLLFDKRIDAQPSFDRARLSRRFLDLISRYEFDHQSALRSYCTSKQLPCSGRGTTISCELESGERLIAEFDERGRLVQLNGE